MSHPLLDVQHLKVFTRDNIELVSGLEFQLRAHEVLLIEGPNGAGKTSLLRVLLGLHPYFEGNIDLYLGPEHIAYVPQLGDLRFLLPLSLKDIVCMDHDHSAKEIVDLGLLSESDLLKLWNSASGGERQKALLSRALLSKTKLFVFDEPLNHLDSRARAQLLKLIDRQAEHGCAFILVAHDYPLETAMGVKRLGIGRADS